MKSRIPITPDIRQSLIDHKDRTGVSVDKLLAGLRADIPQGLNAALINTWIRGKCKSARQDYLSYVLKLYSSLPDNPWVELDDIQRDTIKRIGKRLHGNLKYVVKKDPLPPELTYQTLYRILRGKHQKVRHLNLEYIYRIAENLT